LTFEAQEQIRKETESKKKALQQGAPLPGSIEEFLIKFKKQISESPILKEFITREHSQFKEIIESISKLYNQISEDNAFGVEAKLVDLTAAIGRFEDNFNLFANQLLELEKEKNRRIIKTLDVLDTELKMG